MQVTNDSNEWINQIEEYISSKNVKYYEYKHFSNFQEIGTGSYGKVNCANWKSSKQTFALKTFHKFNNATVKEIIRELELQREVDFHNNIIRIYGITSKQKNNNVHLKKYWLVMEYADGGALKNYLKVNFDKLTWNDKYKFAFQLASAVLCLHEEGIVHRDLHSGNVLIHQGMIKLADFGFSKRVDVATSQSKVFGMIPYIDPKRFGELKECDSTLQQDLSTVKSDVYSVGVLMWEISSGRLPFYVAGKDYDILLAIKILQGLRESIIPGTPVDFINIYTECWDDEPDKRPAMNKVVDELNAIIKKINIIENEKSNLQLPEQPPYTTETSQIINFINGVEKFESNNEKSDDYMIISLKITELNKDEILNTLGELQKYRKLQVLDCNNIQITNLPTLPNSLTELYCNDTKITSLPKLPDSLKILSCFNIQITSLPNLPDSLTKLFCYNTQITSLPNLPDSLIILYCYDTQITSLPNLPDSLTILGCSNTQITSLPNLPDSLIELYCYDTQITSLPNLPDSLTKLSCYNTQITSLPNLSDSLIELSCNDTQITSLSNLPNSLIELYCNDTQITSLSNLPDSLTKLSCYNTQITSLPNLSDSLTKLSCSHTQITSLPYLSDSLTILSCSNTQITSLPNLPDSLIELYCSHTQITSLPNLPDSLTKLYCYNTKITTLPNLPDSLIIINPEYLKTKYSSKFKIFKFKNLLKTRSINF